MERAFVKRIFLASVRAKLWTSAVAAGVRWVYGYC